MTPFVVEIHFKLTLSSKEYEQAIASLAQAIADVAGLQWKIWLLNESTHESCGICLFEDKSSANAFLSGPLIAQLKSAPSITDFSIAQFTVLNAVTAITRGPVTHIPCGVDRG